MEITRARTEAAAAYRQRLASMDTQIRVATVAHTLLGKIVEGEHGDRILGALYGDMAHRTRAVHRVPSPADAVQAAAQRSIALSVAAVLSDFEWACRDLLSDALEFWEKRWTPALGESKPPGPAFGPLAKRGWAGTISEALRTQSASGGFLQNCYSLLGIDATKKDLAPLPLFDFFRRCRNRIIHSDSTAGSDLVDFAKSKDVEAAFKSLGPAVCRMISELPELEPTQRIVLVPAHAIIFLVVVRDLFKALEGRIRQELDDDGYLRMTAYYAYGADHHAFRRAHYNDVEGTARSFLDERYGVREVDQHDLIRRFRKLGLWEAIGNRFIELFPPNAHTRKSAKQGAKT
jgi:hypothetical protein